MSTLTELEETIPTTGLISINKTIRNEGPDRIANYRIAFLKNGYAVIQSGKVYIKDWGLVKRLM